MPLKDEEPEIIYGTSKENPMRGFAFVDVTVPSDLDKVTIKGACGEAFKEVIRCNAAKKQDRKRVQCHESDRHLIECLHWNPEWPSKG